MRYFQNVDVWKKRQEEPGKHCVLIIDPQEEYCLEEVSNELHICGADEAMTNLGHDIFNLAMKGIRFTSVILTARNHDQCHVSNTTSWEYVDKNGKLIGHPPPFVTVKREGGKYQIDGARVRHKRFLIKDEVAKLFPTDKDAILLFPPHTYRNVTDIHLWQPLINHLYRSAIDHKPYAPIIHPRGGFMYTPEVSAITPREDDPILARIKSEEVTHLYVMGTGRSHSVLVTIEDLCEQLKDRAITIHLVEDYTRGYLGPSVEDANKRFAKLRNMYKGSVEPESGPKVTFVIV